MVPQQLKTESADGVNDQGMEYIGKKSQYGTLRRRRIFSHNMWELVPFVVL